MATTTCVNDLGAEKNTNENMSSGGSLSGDGRESGRATHPRSQKGNGELSWPEEGEIASRQNEEWPKFLVVKSLDNKPITKHNTFVIRKAVEGIAGIPKSVIPLKNAGLLLIEVGQKHHAVNLLKCKKLHDIPVEISAHRSMNVCKGVITCDSLEDMTDEQITQHLLESNQKVKEVKRIISMRQGKETPTNTFIITFNSTTLPEKMYVGLYRVNVRLYIPNPRRCVKCQKFGHTKKFCKNNQVCAKCGKENHAYENCTNEPECFNCKGNHPASSRMCPSWTKEKKIIECKVMYNISFGQARKRIESEDNISSNGKKVDSWATTAAKPPSTAVKPTKVDASVQTVMVDQYAQTTFTWPSDSKWPIPYAENTSNSDIEDMDATSESKRKLSVSSSGSMPEINGYASKRKSKIPVTTPKSKADNSGNMSSPPAPPSLLDVNAASMGGGKPTGVQSSSTHSTGKQEATANVSNDDSFKTVENRRRRSRG